jgi:hypothetical protein
MTITINFVDASKLEIVKGAGTLLHVLHECYCFRQKCSKLSTYTTQGLKNNFNLRGFSTFKNWTVHN